MSAADGTAAQRETSDAMDPWAANALVATLGLDRPTFAAGAALPPFWHWMYFREAVPRAQLGRDGHPAVGGFIPDVAQPRRMWAGGRLVFHGSLPLGVPSRRVETIADMRVRTGRTGEMTFVTVRSAITGGQGLAVTEEQDIVYCAAPVEGAVPPIPAQAPRDEQARRAWSCDPVTLFRYSALTFNGHRIHYDVDHARAVEGYPDLVVHGPLLATLLLELVTETIGVPVRFAFRATAPVFAGEGFETCLRDGGEGVALWVRGADGRLAMTAEAGW
jgi:3-methylfumaryl-CoA hydratase